MNSNTKSQSLSTITSLVSSRFDELWSLWSQMDLDPRALTDRVSIVEREMTKHLGRMIHEEEGYVAKITDLIEAHARERHRLTKELGTHVTDPDPDLGLIKLEKELRVQVSELRTEKEHRMEEVLQLKRSDEALCQSMEVEPFPIATDLIPTDTQMSALKAHIRDMQTLKNQRSAQFSDMKLAIIDLLERLEAEPNTTFERTLVCENDAAFILSTPNLQSVKDMLRRLEERLAANRDHAQNLREKIYSLIRKLGQEEAERQRVEIELGGHSPREIKELQQILNELEVLKSEKMEQFIHATRQDLIELWDKCYYSQSQRDKFSPFFDTNYNDELLSIHEIEVERLKSYHEANRDLFQKVAKRQDLWKKMLELEAKQKDPGHLLKAKGNTLLLEERDRKRVNKQLPKIEQELMDEMAQFLEIHGRPFLVGGVSYEDFVEAQVFEHNRLVEDEKQAKLEARKKQNFHETVYGSKPVTPAANRAGAKRKATGQTPVNDSKRYRPELTTRSVSTLRSPYVRAPLSSAKKTHSAHQTSRYGLRPQAAKRKILGDRNDTFMAGHASQPPRGGVPTCSITSVVSDDFFRDIPHSALTSTFQNTPEASSFCFSSASTSASANVAAVAVNASCQNLRARPRNLHSKNVEHLSSKSTSTLR
ncbi:protein regulator of cytokinesis 1-like [Tigriopus californicus]|uniref:protein regulator of cytokinesis 1-like n=1 Tax=Tigriopus californicus TaxID=6832 RepID=UPI0027D9E431|nr:protein regulator of cytokinesis 1-like [Tigriopus californicus]